MPCDRRQAERRAKRVWVSFVTLLLGLQVVIGAVAVRLATSDPSVAVVPDYHQAALNWDMVHRADGAAARQGWTIDVTLSEVADTQGRRVLQVQVTDREGRPVDGLKMTGTLYHHARAAEVQPIQLNTTAAGQYFTTPKMTRRGLWQVILAIDGARQPMRHSTTIEL